MNATTILTYTGQRLDLAHPDPQAINLTDIAHGLAHTIRWRGALGPLTVAQHAVLCAAHYRLAGNPAAQRLALLHDAAEAYLGDVPSPAKRACPHGDLDHLEGDLMRAIAARFDLDLYQDIIVSEVDLDVRAWEVQTFRCEHWNRVSLAAIFGAPSRDRIRDEDYIFDYADIELWPLDEAWMLFESVAIDLGLEEP